MGHFKILLDRSLSPDLQKCFPSKHVLTTESLGLPQHTPDAEIVAIASQNKYLLVAANRSDFERFAREHIATTSKKENGCARVNGLILLIPNEEIVQERVLKGLEQRLTFEGKRITYKDVHDRDLLVHVESTGVTRVEKLPRCPHCPYDD
jgi:Domain of unknown function (DUF5615)